MLHTPLSRRHCLQLLGSAAAMGLQRPSTAAATGAQGMGQLAAWPAGQATPALQAQTLAGAPRSLNDYAGQPLIVNFWATYCAPCRLEMPQFNTLLERFRLQGLQVLAVNHGEMPARVEKFLHTLPFAGDVLLDRSQTQLKAWGGFALPSSFVVDGQGRVRWWHMGEIDWLHPDQQAKLRHTLGI